MILDIPRTPPSSHSPPENNKPESKGNDPESQVKKDDRSSVSKAPIKELESPDGDEVMEDAP